ncbi:MAG: hypothetical protein JW774_08200 [Candidatus Aureabacteria bacterium]|nr:hypothetical protein [Candidatus Auribacterota bacterium]
MNSKSILMVPWTALLVVSVIALRLGNMDLILGSVPSMGVLIGAVLVMALEFLRSGDIQLKKFVWDTTLSVFILIGSTWAVAYMIINHISIHFVEWLVYAIVILDSWLSPINAFRTALRNVQFQGGGGDN